jgi:hypothetical protein
MAGELVPRILAPGEMLEDGWCEGMPVGIPISYEEVSNNV